MDADSVWSAVGSQEFNDKYLVHDYPGVASMAKLAVQIFSTETDIQCLLTKRDRLIEDKKHNNLCPAELYRLIHDLRVENEILKADATNLRMMMSKIDYFVFSNPASTRWDFLSERITLCTTAWQNAIGRRCLSTTTVSSWRVTVRKIDCANSGGISIGVIGSNVNVTAPSHTFASNFGWSHANYVWVAGANQASAGGWTAGWKTGDVGLFSYDPLLQTLTLLKDEVTFTISTVALNGGSAFIHFCLYTAVDDIVVEMLNV